jgi:hypothetical protein
MHKVVELLPVDGTPKQVGKTKKYNSYIFAFAVNHHGMESNVSDEYILSIARKFGEILSENLDDVDTEAAKKRVFSTEQVYQMKSFCLCRMIRDHDVFRILDDVISFSDGDTGKMYNFAELLEIPEMKEVLTGAFGEGNVEGKGEIYDTVTKPNVGEVHQYYR